MLFLNIVLSLVPNFVSVVKQGVLEVEPEHTVVGLGVETILPRLFQNILDLVSLVSLSLLHHFAELDHLKEGVTVLRRKLDGKV